MHYVFSSLTKIVYHGKKNFKKNPYQWSTAWPDSTHVTNGQIFRRRY